MNQAYFDAVAPEWEQMRKEFFSETVRARAVRAAGVGPGSRALDVGAGSGFVTQALLEAGAHVTAVDASPAMVGQLHQRFPAAEARLGDAESLPFAEQAFDAVLANMCLHHVERPWQALAEMARVLAPGGRLVVTDLDRHDFRFLREEHHDLWMGFERTLFQAWLVQAGLRDVSVEGIGESCCATSSCGSETAKVGIFLAQGSKPPAK
jgi:ubiquinone/menaquinone biosynthesis C-methylase UbiE